ncbi:MAG: hypothetical protein RI911_861 [Candidatus Parcubacteria bacterium]|jgi:hypothetical protein
MNIINKKFIKELITASALISVAFATQVSAQTTAPAPTTTPPTTNKVTTPIKPLAQKKIPTPKKPSECVIQALNTREDILIKANTDRYNTVHASFKTRKAELAAAWNIIDVKARKAARDAAWKKFNDKSAQIRRDYRRAVEKAFPNFNASVNACGVDYAEIQNEDSVTTKGTQ